MGGAAILTAERAQGHMVHWLHIANVWSWICHKFALSPSHTIEGGISLVGVLGVSTQALLILVGCYVENRLFEDLTRALGALIATLFVLSTIFVEPRRKADQSGAGRLMPSTHLWLAIVLGVWYLLYCPIQPAPHGFILEPVVAAFGGFIIQLYLSVRNFPVTTRLGILAVISTLHIVRPMFSIGWREPVIIIAGGLTGFFCGAAIHIDAMKTRRLLELAEANRLAVANRHADSKLNHVIKGQCGGAAALVSMLLQAIPAELVLDCSLDLKPHEMLQQIRGMLMQAVEWCGHAPCRKPTPNLYQPWNCTSMPRFARLSLVASRCGCVRAPFFICRRTFPGATSARPLCSLRRAPTFRQKRRLCCALSSSVCSDLAPKLMPWSA